VPTRAGSLVASHAAWAGRAGCGGVLQPALRGRRRVPPGAERPTSSPAITGLRQPRREASGAQAGGSRQGAAGRVAGRRCRSASGEGRTSGTAAPEGRADTGGPGPARSACRAEAAGRLPHQAWRSSRLARQAWRSAAWRARRGGRPPGASGAEAGRMARPAWEAERPGAPGAEAGRMARPAWNRAVGPVRHGVQPPDGPGVEASWLARPAWCFSRRTRPKPSGAGPCRSGGRG
jgi:hypothetical protein